MPFGVGMRHVLTMALFVLVSSSTWAADDGVWSVSKSSGEVWVSASGAQQASLTQEETLKPGDTIRTGRNGRVLLVRGEETMLISPNSVIGLSTDVKDGISTTVLQQAGSMLLEVEKRNVKHFEVETPYLAAVVKGTQFSVTVNAGSTSVGVRRGQVEVSDFKSGQVAQVLPGQTATSFETGKGGLTLNGSGTFNPIEQGKPRASSVDRVPVPKGGLPAPRSGAGSTVIHALDHMDQSFVSAQDAPPSKPAKPNVIRISAPLGEVKLNVEKATHGLARGSSDGGSSRIASHKDNAIWSNGAEAADGARGATGQNNSNSSSSGGNNNAGGNGGNGGNGNGNGGNGNGNSGNGNGGGVSATVSTLQGATAGVVAGTNGIVNGVVGTGKGLTNGTAGGALGAVGGLLGRH
jgi:hypothetical protein